MMSTIALVPWFEEGPLPSILPDPAIILGGTFLLPEFIGVAASLTTGGRLSMAAAYVGEGLGAEMRALEAMHHDRIEVSVATHHARDARRVWSEIGAFPWRSLAIHVYPRLHAKIYAFVTPAEGGVCLVGSHNLSRRGTRWNDEAGTLFVGRRDPGVQRIIQACDDQVQRFCEKGRTAIDTRRWPAASDLTGRRTA